MLDLIRHLLTPAADGVSEDTIYAEHCAEFRALNIIFWQIPVIVTTLNGGLWFALASLELTDWGQRMILWFAVAVNIAFFVSLTRLRAIMERLLREIHRFEGRSKEPGSYTVLTMFGLLMLIATIGAIVVSVNPSLFFQKRSPEAVVVLCTGAGTMTGSCRTIKPG